MTEKNKTNYSPLLFYFIYLLIVGLFILFVLWMIFMAKKYYTTNTKYQPFANLAEFKLSSNIQINPANFLIRKMLDISTYNDNSSLSNIEGEYKRYPLDREIQATSIVAVDANNRQPDLAAWHVEVGSPGVNWLWPDGTSSYWICPVNVNVHPVVVIKGTFPRARYMSLYSYDGIDINDASNIGRGLTKFSVSNVNTCNSSVPGNCAGLADYQIEPDEGSKNPFRDSTFDPNFDTCDYTVFFISPNYDGILPASKNILPLSSTNSTSALITLRVYAPFNPIGCNSRDFVNNKTFDTTGCSSDGIRTFIPGGSKYPETLNHSPCSLSDKTCIEEGTGFEFERTLPKDCHKFVGNNKYCVCLGDNPTSKCGQYLDAAIKYYTNHKGNLKSFCQGGPELEEGVSYCIDDIQLKNGKMGVDVTKTEKCDPNDNLCAYVKQGRLQQCVAKKLYKSDNPACTPFKNPINLPEIKDSDNECQLDFANMICECSGIDKEKCKTLSKNNPDLFINGYLQNQPPPYGYQPEYNFENCPPSDCSGCNTFTCEYNSCIPRVGGEYDNSSCDENCPPCTIHPPQPIQPKLFKCAEDGTTSCVECEEDENCTFKSIQNCEDSCVIENYNDSGNSICNSNIKNFTCGASSKQKYIDLAGFSVNTHINSTTVASGWVGLPDVFVKYQWNDYFINLNNYQNVKSILSVFKGDIVDIGNYLKYSNLNDPLDPFQVKKQNPQIDIQTYSEEETPLIENYSETRKENRDCDNEKKCKTYVDENTYFPIGTRYPNPSIKKQNVTKLVLGPGCNYYQDLCNCEAKQTLRGRKFMVQPQCGLEKTLKIDGSPCFSRWGLDLPNMCLLKNKENCNPKDTLFKFSGTAIPFSISANTSDVVIFPNPDTGYVGALTQFSKEHVYVIWMDIPSTPATPGFENIIKNDYQARYCSIGHYYYGLSKTNLRPILSSRMDNELIKTPITYKDQKTGKRITSNRVCILLASSKQYDMLAKYKCLSKKLTWLDWGVTKTSKLVSGDKVKNQVQENFTIRKSEFEYLEDEAETNVDSENLSSSPEYGFIIYRQMLPNNELFQESIENYVISNPDCLNKTIDITDEKYVFTSKDVDVKSPVKISKSCNPGPSLCQNEKGDIEECSKKYNLDPCCVAKEPLSFMKQYYPRCEKIKICDIVNMGELFWEQYTNFPLPYKYNVPNTDATPKPSACPPVTSPPSYTPQPMNNVRSKRM